MVEAMLLHEGLTVAIFTTIILFIGIAIGIDVESNRSNNGATFQTLILLPVLILSLIGIFFNYSVRDETIQYLIKNKTDKEIKELNTTKDIKKVIVYNYLKIKEKEIK